MAKKQNEITELCKELQKKLSWSDTKTLVLSGTTQGFTNNQIAKAINKSRRNVRKHRKSLYDFFSCKDKNELLEGIKRHLAN